jgi:hypothetical protein
VTLKEDEGVERAAVQPPEGPRRAKVQLQRQCTSLTTTTALIKGPRPVKRRSHQKAKPMISSSERKHEEQVCNRAPRLAAKQTPQCAISGDNMTGKMTGSAIESGMAGQEASDN